MSKTKAQLETELRSLRAKLANAEKLAIERLNRLNDMQMDFNAAEDARREAIKQRDAALQDRNAAKKHVAKLEETVADRNGKITRLHEERDAALQERDYAKGQAEKAWAELDPARKERDELKNHLEASKEVIDRMQRVELAYQLRIDELTKQLHTAECECDRLKSKTDELETLLFDAQHEGKTHKEWMEDARRQRDEYAAKLVENGAAVSFLEGQLDAAKAELTSSRLELKAELTNLRLGLESASNLRKLIEADRSKAESRADYWETRAREAMRPWWCRVWDRVRRNGGAR